MKRYILLLFVIVLGLPSSLAQETKNLLILQTSDTHSRIEPIEQAGDSYFGKGGFIRRATMIKHERAINPYLFLFDCGDFSQGTPYYNLFKGKVEIDLMNEMKYDAVTIGNHEFDYGLDNMARLFKRAKFPIVCSNYDFRGTVLQKLVKPYVVFVRNGVRVGVFGLSPKLEGLVQKKNYQSIVYEDPIPIANNMALMLRETQKCDVVICLSHLGIQFDKMMIPKTRNIDIVLGGHTHTFMNAPESYADMDGKIVKVLHTGVKGVKVGKIEMVLKKQ
jgi:5'-nucleotidase